MQGARARRDDTETLFDRIGLFLADQRLSADPEHYRFAHAVLSDPNGAMAQAVSRLVDGGVRLSRNDIEALGGRVVASAPVPPLAAVAAAQAEAREQVEDFAEIVRTMRDEARDFGRDLAASAAEISQMPRIEGLDEIARVAGTMIARVHDAEARLATATREADSLREKLAEAEEDARSDMLTGLANRRAFMEAFANRAPAAAPWCLALCDVDRFKRINDVYGHPVGDRVLSAVARTLAETCEGHLVARHGGEEFGVLLRAVTLAEAADVLDRARAEVAAKRFRDRETGIALGMVTFSAGLTAIHAGDTAETAFARADRLLYNAKEAGRNRIAIA
jgi:diguanylate cyclase